MKIPFDRVIMYFETKKDNNKCNSQVLEDA